MIDPVLCELAYSWWCPPNGLILDPFATGTVHGFVAAKMGRSYLGFGLSAKQVAEARQAADHLLGNPGDPADCDWVAGDIRDNGHAEAADFLFGEPPDDFAAKDYRDVIARASFLLAPDRFACFVVGDLRDSQGFLRNLPGETISAFIKAGLHYYDEAILAMSPGGAARSAPKVFERDRRLATIHRRVLCFVKGDALAAARAVGPVESAKPIEDEGEGEVEEEEVEDGEE